MTLDHELSALLPKAIDPFLRTAITGAQHALADIANPLRPNFFALRCESCSIHDRNAGAGRSSHED